jgi:bifunctional non-homologous end joining protein LigD
MGTWASRPMPLLRLPVAFDHPDCLFELKHDGLRALAIVEGHRCELVSRRRHVYKQFPQLAEELAHSIRAHDAVLDAEIICLTPDGRSKFNNLLFRRDWPHFIAIDLRSIEGADLRGVPLEERKRRLNAIMPRLESRRLYLDHVAGRAVDRFREVCRRDLEGFVAKRRFGCYHSDGITTTWFKVKNPTYTRGIDRADLFAPRRLMAAPSPESPDA